MDASNLKELAERYLSRACEFEDSLWYDSARLAALSQAASLIRIADALEAEVEKRPAKVVWPDPYETR